MYILLELANLILEQLIIFKKEENELLDNQSDNNITKELINKEKFKKKQKPLNDLRKHKIKQTLQRIPHHRNRKN